MIDEDRIGGSGAAVSDVLSALARSGRNATVSKDDGVVRTRRASYCIVDANDFDDRRFFDVFVHAIGSDRNVCVYAPVASTSIGSRLRSLHLDEVTKRTGCSFAFAETREELADAVGRLESNRWMSVVRRTLWSLRHVKLSDGGTLIVTLLVAIEIPSMNGFPLWWLFTSLFGVMIVLSAFLDTFSTLVVRKRMAEIRTAPRPPNRRSA